MLNFQGDIYDRYKFEYNKFVSGVRTKCYDQLADSVVYESAIATLLRYNSTQKSEQIFLVVPSIFNSPEILFLNEGRNFISNLQEKGDVYLVNWQENTSPLVLEDYINELQTIILLFGKKEHRDINLIGHCIGGTMCIAAASQTLMLSSLTLLTCPWDYSHFRKWTQASQLLVLDEVIAGFEFIPKIYTQIMFFLMFPLQFKDKILKYFSLESVEKKELFMKVEEWLGSGIAISKTVYRQIIQDFCQSNTPANNQWFVNGQLVTLEKLNIPVCIIYASDDQIVPFSSIDPLQKTIKDSTLIEVNGGHISYLVNGDANFYTQYNGWLKQVI